MNALYSLLLASGTKEALFAALWLALDEKPGTLADTTFADLQATANRFGVALSDSQIRKRVAELEKRGLVAVKPRRERGRFDLKIFSPAIVVSVAVSATATETVAESVEATVENRAEVAQNPAFVAVPEPVATVEPPRVCVRACDNNNNNNNKYKNKTINKPAKVCNIGAQAVDEARSTDDVRSVVDFGAPKVAALRRLVARTVWERTVHPDLIDRITALAVLGVGGATAKTVEAIIRDAKDEVSLWSRTDGRRGKQWLWQALTPEIKRLYENAGWVWTPTRFATEPRPETRRVEEAAVKILKKQ